VAVGATASVFLIAPSLSTPTALSLVATVLLSPWVSALERKGYSRPLAISMIFLVLAFFTGSLGFWLIQSGMAQWDLFKEHAPTQYNAALQRIRDLELGLRSQYPFLSTSPLIETVGNWIRDTAQWLISNGPSLMGHLFAWTLIIPPLTFVLLNEGRSFRRGFFHLIPNRFFESFFLITTDISSALSDYLRAKIVEALLLGLLVTLGLSLIKAPYAIVLGLVAAFTNVLPYLGPILGAIPGILITAFDPSLAHLAIPVTLVYFAANLIDSILIFPFVVAKLINLHPLVLVAVVAVGQHYHGLVGMLIATPIATAIKVILQEIYTAIYKQKVEHSGSTLHLHIGNQ